MGVIGFWRLWGIVVKWVVYFILLYDLYEFFPEWLLNSSGEIDLGDLLRIILSMSAFVNSSTTGYFLGSDGDRLILDFSLMFLLVWAPLN